MKHDLALHHVLPGTWRQDFAVPFDCLCGLSSASWVQSSAFPGAIAFPSFERKTEAISPISSAIEQLPWMGTPYAGRRLRTAMKLFGIYGVSEPIGGAAGPGRAPEHARLRRCRTLLWSTPPRPRTQESILGRQEQVGTDWIVQCSGPGAACRRREPSSPHTWSYKLPEAA